MNFLNPPHNHRPFPREMIRYLRSILSYDPDTGHIRWKDDRNGRVIPRSHAGCIQENGELMVKVRWQGHRYAIPGTRLAVVLHTARDPGHRRITCSNGYRSDLRLKNLAVTDRSKAGRKTVRSSNTSGCPGVCFIKGRQHWQATISVNGKRRWLGQYATREEAVRARKAAEAAIA